MNNNRKKKVIKNIIAQTTYSGIQAVMSFVLRKIFIIYLSKELLGLNGLLTSVIGMLSIAELGVGEAINFSLYKPLANNDKEQIKSIMRLYKRLYVVIGFAIVVLGLVLMPFLPLIIKTDITIDYVYRVYLFFLLDTFLSYCLAYSRNIISADQQDYIVTNVDSIAQIVVTVLQSAALVITRNYFLYMAVKILVTVLRNYYLYKKSYIMFPYLTEGNIKPLTKEYKSNLLDNVKALFVTKVAYYCVSGTDNILLSSFVSLGSVAVYTNYVTILSLINKTFNTIFDKARAGIGNFLETERKEDAYNLFKRFFFINFILTSYTSIELFMLCNEVIYLWLGEEFVWSIGIVGVLVYNNYARFILQSCEAFRGAAGLYSPRPFVKYLSFAEGIINLVVSVFFLQIFHMGVLGVFLGTAVSTVVSTIAVPWIVYKFLFKKSLIQYYSLYFKYLLAAIGALTISYIIFKMIYLENHWLNLFLGGFVSTLVTVAVYTLFFYKTDEYQYLFKLIKQFLGNISAKLKK